MDKKTLTVACKAFFGLKDGQDLKGFSEEMKALTQADRNDLAALFQTIGIEIVPMPGKSEV